jgi:hypothetical protein
MEWIYVTELEIYTNGLEEKKIIVSEKGKCTKIGCNCSGSMTYFENENLESERQEIENLGFIFFGKKEEIE